MLRIITNDTLNSLYGITANKWFNFCDVNLSKAITLSGQMVIKWSERYLNEYINKLLKTDKVDYIIAIDTDSVMVDMTQIVSKCMPGNHSALKITDFMDRICKIIERDCINPAYARLSKMLNCSKQLMTMDREVLSACVTGDTLVTMAEGNDIEISKLRVGEIIKSLNIDTGLIESDIVSSQTFMGNKEVYEISFDGKVIEATADHLFGINRDGYFIWCRVDLLIETDEIVTL